MLRQQDKTFFTEADLTKWWTDHYDGTEAGVLHDPDVGTITGYGRGVLPTTEQFEAYEPSGVSARIAEYMKKVADVFGPNELCAELIGLESASWKTEKVSGPVTTVAGNEANWVHTSDTALYGLAAIENLALVGDRMQDLRR